MRKEGMKAFRVAVLVHVVILITALPIVILNSTGTESLAAGVSQQQDNNPLKHDNKCWAEIYMNAEFDKNGSRLLLVGPHELTTLKSLNDQNWDNDIESIIVGPEAYMVLYADQEFGGRTLILIANQNLGNLSDAQMKNDIESLRLSCK
ncbi:MAG: hypothetical protein JSR31_15640 [Nitrospira sp.]|nr:hypothetical protein [Nitrospira sp.]